MIKPSLAGGTMRIARLPFVILLAAACVNAPQETSTGGAAKAPHGGPVRIGFSMDTLKEERWQRDKRLVEQRAKEVGAVLDVQVANGDNSTDFLRALLDQPLIDRKSTRLNSSHVRTSYAVFCL